MALLFLPSPAVTHVRTTKVFATVPVLHERESVFFPPDLIPFSDGNGTGAPAPTTGQLWPRGN